MRDGKVIDGTAFYDSISFNELWSRVQPRSGRPASSAQYRVWPRSAVANECPTASSTSRSRL
jgi:hypothetical protein